MLVEDNDTQGAVIGMMRSHLPHWGKSKEQWPVHIEIGGSADEVLKESGLQVMLKASGVTTLGVIVDADASLNSKWYRIRDFCRKLGGGVPDDCPPQGLIIDGILDRRFGAWIMPNNRDAGMLENFCHKLIPANDRLWSFAQASAASAKQKGASYVEAHVHKAEMHTWLAWQDPPGERMGNAITKKILVHDAEAAKPFVRWFRELYNV